jgi:hypothetical protein
MAASSKWKRIVTVVVGGGQVGVCDWLLQVLKGRQ